MKCIIYKNTGFPSPEVQLITYGNRNMPLANLRSERSDLHHIKFLLQWSVLLLSDLSHSWQVGWGHLRRKMIGVLVMAGPRVWRRWAWNDTGKGMPFSMARPLAWKPRWSDVVERECAKAWSLRCRKTRTSLWIVERGYWKNIFK